MGCQKLTYYQEPAFSASWKIFSLETGKNVSGSKFCIDYYTGGMVMPGRSFNSSSNRYLYQGMEQDPEISGEGNSYTTLYRQYDPRLMRWKSLDPLKDQMPWISPYAMNFNNPLVYNDTDGDIPWPRIVSGGRFTSAFGTRIHPVKGGLKYHAGIDLGAPLGSSIRAAASGTVVYAGDRSGYGNVVIIDHGNGYYSQYAHMTAEGIYVKVGERVNNGQVIAAVGNEGFSTGPHLHLEFHRMTDPFTRPQQLTPSGGSEPGTSFDPTSIPDLHEKLNGAPEKLTEKEAKEWNNLVAKRDRLATRIGINQGLSDINNTLKKDNSFRANKISKLQGKLDKTESRLGELRKTNASRYTPSIEVGELEGGEIVRD